jgi:tripartite-type tricarboxylate transporter receptor subunit TctC
MDRFHGELVKALNQADVRKTLGETLGMDLVVSTPETLQQWNAREMAKWSKVIKDNNIKTD